MVEERVRDAAIDRRLFLKRAAIVTWSAPAIVTVMSSPAYGQVSCPSPGSQGVTCSTTTVTCDITAGCCCCVTGGCLAGQACSGGGTNNANRCCFPTGYTGTGNPCATNTVNSAAQPACCAGQCGTGAAKTSCK